MRRRDAPKRPASGINFVGNSRREPENLSFISDNVTVTEVKIKQEEAYKQNKQQLRSNKLQCC